MRKQIIAICLILAMFAAVQTAELAVESLEDKLAGGAHLYHKLVPTNIEWVPRSKTKDYKYDESITGHKCVSHLQCDAERLCSRKGWCQDKP